jgi:C1A family cysteine protease
LTKAQAWGKKYKTADEIPDSEIPDQYDFTNIDGYDFTNPVRDQGACGSCYTVSFTQVIESRLKLKYGKEAPQLSAQYLM